MERNILPVWKGENKIKRDKNNHEYSNNIIAIMWALCN